MGPPLLPKQGQRRRESGLIRGFNQKVGGTADAEARIFGKGRTGPRGEALNIRERESRRRCHALIIGAMDCIPAVSVHIRIFERSAVDGVPGILQCGHRLAEGAARE